MKRFLFLLVIVAAVGILASCNLLNPVVPGTTPTTTEVPTTSASPATTTEIPVTNAPATDAPVTDAPVTNPPATEPPVTEAPIVYTGLLKDYQIVFAEGDEEARANAVELKNLLGDKGLTLSVVSDYSNDSFPPPYGFQLPRATEILIGATNRIENDEATLPAKNYRISIVGARILIEAGSNEAMVKAISDLAASYLKGTDDELSCTITAENAVSYRSPDYNNFTIGTKLPTAIYADAFGAAYAEELSAFLSANAGLMLDIRKGTPADGEGAIVIKVDPEYGAKYELAVEGSIITVGAASKKGLELACDVLLLGIDGLKTGNLEVTDAINDSASYIEDIETVAKTTDDYLNYYDKATNEKRGTGAEIIGTTLKNPLDYRAGDEIAFAVGLVYGKAKVPYGCTSFKYVISADGVEPTQWATVNGASGELLITIPEKYTQKTGSVRLRVQAFDSKSNMIAEYYGGAYINREEITSVIEKPADYDEFWQERIQEVLDTSPTSTRAAKKAHESNYFHWYEIDEEYMGNTPNYTKSAAYLQNFRIFEVFLKSPGYMPAVFYIAIPKTANEQSSLPFQFSFNAYGSRNGYLGTNGASYFIAIGPNGVPGVYYDEETGTYTPVNYSDYSTYDDAHKGYHTSFGLKVSDYTNTETTADAYLTRMLQRNLQVVRFLTDERLTAGTPFELVSKTYNGKMTGVGGSMGGFQSIAMAAIFEMIPDEYTIDGQKHQNKMGHFESIDIRCPWFCDPIGMAGHPDRIAGLGTRIKEGFTDYEQILGAAYLDSAYFGEYLKCEVQMVAGFADITCPSTGIMAFYNSVPGNINLDMTQNKDHSGHDPVTMITDNLNKK